MQKHDFLFGNIHIGDGCSIVSLRQLNAIGKKVPAEFFTESLNRLLKENNGHLIVNDGGSAPDFPQFLDKVVPQGIGYLDIYPRTDINNSQVIDCTLACDLMLLEGIVSIRPHWAAYKDIRAEELINTLLMPIYLKGLQDRTYLIHPDERSELLASYFGNGVEELKKVLNLAKASPICLTPESMTLHARKLQLAGTISLEGLSLNDAYEQVLEDLKNES